MPEDKSKAVEAGQSRVVADQDHEVSHRAETPTTPRSPSRLRFTTDTHSTPLLKR